MARRYRTACALLVRLLVAAIPVVPLGACSNLVISPASAAASSAPLPSAEEEWEEDEEEWEVEDDEEEWEVEDDGEWEVEGGEGDWGWEVPDEPQRGAALDPCTSYRGNARVVAAERLDTVLLEVSYPSKQAKRVRVEYWLKGSRGALQLAPLRERTSRRGSLRRVERLSARKMSKVRAARAFVVDLDMAGTPSYCDRYSTRHLTARQRHGDRMVWSEPGFHGPLSVDPRLDRPESP